MGKKESYFNWGKFPVAWHTGLSEIEDFVELEFVCKLQRTFVHFNNYSTQSFFNVNTNIFSATAVMRNAQEFLRPGLKFADNRRFLWMLLAHSSARWMTWTHDRIRIRKQFQKVSHAGNAFCWVRWWLVGDCHLTAASARQIIVGWRCESNPGGAVQS